MVSEGCKTRNDNKVRRRIVLWRSCGKKVVSEDREKILALIIVTLSFLSLPVLLFLLVVVVYIDATYAIQFYNTGNFTDGLIAFVLAIVSAGLFLVLRTLTKWIRKS